jgi:hypothetical protein
MARFHGEETSNIDASEAVATLKDPEFSADLTALRGYLVKIKMKNLIELHCWGFPITKTDILNNLCDRLETGELDDVFDVSIEEVSMEEVKQLVEQKKMEDDKQGSIHHYASSRLFRKGGGRSLRNQS